MSKAYLVLENGKIFEGQSFGLQGEVTAEVVFTTGMTGYLETLTDKNYFGQIVVQTFPSIGNYGVITSDFESRDVSLSGYIVKEWCQVPSNFRSEGELDTFLKERGIVGLCGIDTRTLTKVIRENGVMNGAIVTDPSHADLEKLKGFKANGAAAAVSVKEKQVGNKGGSCKVALMDYGFKKDLYDELEKRGAEITVCPYNTTADEIKALGADGIMLSNGPGDPAADPRVIENVKDMLKLNIPVFGVGMGHQLLALANGFKTEKLKYGHRGANQPVKNLETGRVYITGQNHGYVVDAATIDAACARESFVNVNDQTNEGIKYLNHPSASVQFYPEMSGSTMDTLWLFDDFFKNMD